MNDTLRSVAADLQEFETLWIDVLSFTKNDWLAIDGLYKEFMQKNYFNADPKKCFGLAFAVWVCRGNGIKEANH